MASAGGKRDGAGRKKGSPNKVTAENRARIQELLNDQGDKPKEQLEALDGKPYLDAINALYEYVLPKLQRTELAGADGKELKVQVYILPDGTKLEF